MKQIFICTLLSISCLFGTAYAEDYSALDVFEEYATLDTPLISESFSIETTKNTPVEGKLRYESEIENPTFEITIEPTKGKLELTGETGEFKYTPNEDETGSDSFSFRLVAGEVSSNISSCTVTINEAATPSPSPEPLSFIYEDMQNHWGNYSAVKMVERDILKGERIGSKYYFYPDTLMRRIDVINYILSSLDADLNNVDTNETHLFADSTSLPEYINKIAYVAHKLGIIDGEQRGEEVYLNPYAYVNRAELIKMIDTAMSSKTKSDIDLNEYNDGRTIPDWAAQHVKNLIGYGIIKGFEDKTIRPYDNLSKAQAVEMLYQMIKYNETTEVQTMTTRIKNGFYGKLIA